MGCPRRGSAQSWLAIAIVIEEIVSVSTLACRRIWRPICGHSGIWRNQLKMHMPGTQICFNVHSFKQRNLTDFNPKPLTPNCRRLRSMEFCLGPSQAIGHGLSLGWRLVLNVWLQFWGFDLKGSNVVHLEALTSGTGALEVTLSWIQMAYIYHLKYMENRRVSQPKLSPSNMKTVFLWNRIISYHTSQ